MLAKEQLIRQYFNCWLTKQFPTLTTFFTNNCHYRECYGATYHGTDELQQWIDHQLPHQTVLAWDIQRLGWLNDNLAVVEWYFKASEADTTTDFDGVSIIEFSTDKITKLTEYATKHATFRPFAANV